MYYIRCASFVNSSYGLPLEVADIVLVGIAVVVDVVVDIEMGDKEVDIDVGIELTEEIFRYDINLNILISLMQ